MNVRVQFICVISMTLNDAISFGKCLIDVQILNIGEIP